MTLTTPYKQKNYMGECASDSDALTFIRTNKWDSTGDGNGNPRNGMFYYNTVSSSFKLYNGSWVDLTSGTSPGGSNHQIQYNNGGSFGGASSFVWDDTNSRVGIGCTDPQRPLELSSDTSNNYVLASTFSSSANSGFTVKRSEGTRSSPSAVTNGKTLGGYTFNGQYNTGLTDSSVGSAVYAYASENWNSTNRGSHLAIFTTNTGSITHSEKIRITHDGKFGIMNTGPSALLALGTAGTTAGSLSLAGATTGVVTINVAADAGTWSLTLPTDDGAANQYLKTNGSGVCSWATPTAGPAGSDTQIQYNNGGAMGGCASFYWDDVNSRIGLGCSDPQRAIELSDTASNYILVSTFSSSSNGGFFTRRAEGTRSSPTAVTNTKTLGSVRFCGQFNTGITDYSYGSAIYAYASENWSDTNRGSHVAIFTTNIGATAHTEKVRIAHDGKFGILNTDPTSVLDVAGDIEVGSSNYHYWGDPTTNGSWRSGLDTGNFVIQKRVSGSWVTKGTFS